MKWQGLIMVIPASVALWQLFQQPLSWRHGAAVGLFALIGLGIRETWQRWCKNRAPLSLSLPASQRAVEP